jgi:probable biosynthetic protein (TIGR04098 family)
LSTDATVAGAGSHVLSGGPEAHGRWLERSFMVGMPHMVPGQLSEVELLKLLGDAQWHSISTILNIPSAKIVNDQNERLYASFICLDLNFGRHTPMEFGEGTTIHVLHTSRFFSRRFVEGFFCFGNSRVPLSTVENVTDKEQLETLGLPWLYVTNAFVTREVSNLKLKTFAPVGADYGSEFTTEIPPAGIRDHEEVERTGRLALPGMELATPVAVKPGESIVYDIVPESDLNGAGLLYFARYVAIANYGERLFLRRCSAVEVSSPMIRYLTTVRRQIFYFANANDDDSVKLQVSAFVSRPAEGAFGSSTVTAPLQFHFVTELRRKSDGVVMARSVSHKVLLLAKRAKSLILDAGRIGKEMGLSS